MSQYDPKIHNRRSIRLEGYDYSQEGMYFITACCHGMKHRFGEIENDLMLLNELGQIANNEWLKLPTRFQNIELGDFQIMPNHMHGILILTKYVGAGLDPAHIPAHSTNLFSLPNPSTPSNSPTVGDIVGAYKSLVFDKCLDIFESKGQMMGKFWQRNYYEHIIRDRDSFHAISEYIINNPFNWKKDKFYSL